MPADSSGRRPETDYSYGTFGAGFKLLTGKTEKIDATHSLTTAYAYNASNFFVPQTTAVDPTGLNLVTTYTYDVFGNPTQADGPRTDVADIANFTWDADRRSIFVIQADPDGAGPHPRPAVKTTYDAVGRTIEVDTGTTTSAAGGDFAATLSVTTAYDPAGNKIKETTPTKVTQFAYDGANRVLCTALRMNPAVYGSLPSDACALYTAGSYGADRITKNVYDAAGEVLQEIRAFGTPVQQTYATNTWQPDGKLASVTDADGAAHITTYSYDGFDRPYTSTFADGTFERVTSYDNDNNILTRRNRSGQNFTFTYDALDRVRTKAVPASGTIAANTITTTYDLLNKVTAVTDTYGNTLANVYDLPGRQTSATRTTPGLSAKTVSYQYDAASNRTRLTWPDGYYANYSYDALNNPATVVDSNATTLATYSYDDLGRRSQLQYNGITGAKMTYSWSAENDLLALASDFSGTANDVSFTNSFNPAHQWITATVSNAAFLYVPPATATDTYTAVNALNQYPSVSGAVWTYDTRGNQTGFSAGASTALAYDAENRLMSDSAASVTFTYDPNGRRTAKTTGFITTTNFLHDGDSEIAEYDRFGSLIRYFVPGPAIDEYIAVVTPGGNGTTSYFHTDKMGSVIAMSSASGTLVEGPYVYDPYGNCRTSAGAACSAGVPFRFTGQRLDPETGFHFYRARYYDSAHGRFIQTDPVAYKDDLNLYAYVGNDPTDRMDPTGLVTVYIELGGVLIGGLGSKTGGGIYITTENSYGTPDVGVFRSGPGVGVGANIGIGGVVGYVNGSTSNFRGNFINVDVGAGRVQGSVSFTPAGSKTFSHIVGASVGASYSPTAGGVDLSVTNTKTVGLLEDLVVPSFPFAPHPTDNQANPTSVSPTTSQLVTPLYHGRRHGQGSPLIDDETTKPHKCLGSLIPKTHCF